MRTTKFVKCLGCVGLMAAMTLGAEPLPSQLAGTWKITRILPTHNVSCWSTEQAQTLLGTTLSYSNTSMKWRDGEVAVEEISVRTTTEAEFRKESSLDEGTNFSQLGIRSTRVVEVDLQHEDADVTGGTTEIPGDTILIAGPNRIIVSACGVYFEALRTRLNTASTTIRAGAGR